jgi:hypothetical protein
MVLPPPSLVGCYHGLWAKKIDFPGYLTPISFDDIFIGCVVSKHNNTLAAIFETPTRANVRWRDAESLLRNKGAKITQGRGSRVRVLLNGIVGNFHEPHPRPEMCKAAVEDLRDLLQQAGIGP